MGHAAATQLHIDGWPLSYGCATQAMPCIVWSVNCRLSPQVGALLAYLTVLHVATYAALIVSTRRQRGN